MQQEIVFVELSRNILDELESLDTSFEDEIQKQEPQFRISYAGKAKEGTKDLATVITATAALAPLIVPTVGIVFKRLFPQRDIDIVELTKADGTKVCKISIRDK